MSELDRRKCCMVRFMVFSDLHYDEMADGDKRLNELINVIKIEQLDFCVSLGDFCEPHKSRNEIYQKIKSAGVQVHYVIGNHEVENYQLDEVLRFLAMERDFYTFECEDCKFVILNSCYFRKKGRDYPYCGKNYKKDGTRYPFISQEQVDWLQSELEDNKRHIIFSHHSLINEFKDRGINNREVVRKLFNNKNVILCMNGHDHGDKFSMLNGVLYHTINSASYMWAGGYIAESKELMERYGYLHGIIPYKQALYALVEIDKSEIKVNGIVGNYEAITPDDLGISNRCWNGVSPEPNVSSYRFHL